MICRALLILALSASSALAVPIQDCDRLTLAHHAGSSSHQDLGNQNVVWIDWWYFLGREYSGQSVELADCSTGVRLRMLTGYFVEIWGGVQVNRTDEMFKALVHHARTSPATFTVDRMASLFGSKGVPTSVAQYDTESCACHAAYPELRGAKEPYEAKE